MNSVDPSNQLEKGVLRYPGNSFSFEIRDKRTKDFIPALFLLYNSFSDWYKKVVLIIWYSYFVAEYKDKFVGLVIPRKINGNIGEIYLIAVNWKYRGIGMGSELLKKALNSFKEEKMKKCIAWIRVNNDVAKGMYLKSGFENKEGGIKKRIFGEDLFLMELNLTSFTRF